MKQVDDRRQLVRIERHILEEELVVDHRIRIDDADRVAVRLRILAGARADIACAAGTVLDDQRLAELLRSSSPSTRMKMSLMPPALEVVSTWIGRLG